MLVYTLNIFLIILEGLWLLYQVPTKKNKKRFCILVSVQWIIISGFRHISIGSDTQQYMTNFERVKNYSWSYVLDFARSQVFTESDAKAPGYTFLEKVFQVFCKNYQIFLIAVALLFFGCMGYSIYKNSKNPALSFILFSCLFYSFFGITGTRQTIATAIVVFIGIEFIKQRRFISFVICVVILSTVHLSAVCFLPFYWIARIPITKKTIIIYWCLIIIAYAFRTRFISILHILVGYENYTQTQGARAGTFVYLLILVALIITFFHRIILENNYDELEVNITENKKKSNSMLQMSMNAIFVACIFSSLLLINQNTMRVVQYYSVFLLFLLPEIPNMFSNRRDGWIYNIIVVVVLFALFMNGNHEYYFFWQNINL